MFNRENKTFKWFANKNVRTWQNTPVVGLNSNLSNTNQRGIQQLNTFKIVHFSFLVFNI